jgi:DNA polymerase (family X)
VFRYLHPMPSLRQLIFDRLSIHLPGMTNKQIARALHETSSLIELTGGNTFRARAFSSAGRTLERMEEQAVDLLENGSLEEVRGFGKGLVAQIRELVATGTFELRDELLGSIPPGVVEMLRVKGIGAKKARTVWQQRDITSIDQLEAAAETGRLSDLPGFGVKTQEKILEAVRKYQRFSSARRYASVIRELVPVLDRMKSLPGVQQLDLAGALRRSLEIVSSAEILLSGHVEKIVAGLKELYPDAEVRAEAGVQSMVTELPDGLPLRLYVTSTPRHGSTLFRLTGSAEFTDGWLAEFDTPADDTSETSIFESAGIAYIPPELRESLDVIQVAGDDGLPSLITVEDLRGSLHNHSTYSDGAHTLTAMAEHARSMGLEYFGISDHSRTLTVANGLSVGRVQEQQKEVEELNAEYGSDFRIFSGIESDILKDGSLDYPDDVLATFDFIVASVHSGFNMTEEEATQRIIRAVENPYTRILGHMTGRLLLTRDGYPVDHLRIIDACASNGVAIELNANPHRLDMDWRFIRNATERGVLISINPDAHSIDELHYVHWGVAVARKGWLEKAQCLNAMPRKDFERWLADRSYRLN